MNNHIKTKIEKMLHSSILHAETLSGGMISQVVKLTFDHHKELVLKLSDNSHDLTIEAYMLHYLIEYTHLPIPRVIHAEPHFILIEYIDGDIGLSASTEYQLGQLIATLHQITQTQYGLECDTLIGPIHQPNNLMNSWVDFFREHRLLYMAKIALNSEHLPDSIYKRLLELSNKLDQFLIEPDMPSLIHGDLWTSNILVKDDRVIGIIDPALYYAHNEMELAYMTLFNS